MNSWYQKFHDKIDIPSQSVEVSTRFGENHVLTMGKSNGIPLVLLHSMLTSSAHLLSELSSLADTFYIIAPDIPGQSVKGLPTRLSYKDSSHSDWLKDILDGFDLDATHVAGVSLGGFIARQFASNHPERVQTLTLIVPAGIVQGSLLKGFATMIPPMILYKIRPSEHNLHKLVKHLITTRDEDWAHYLGDTFNDFTPNLKIPPLASKKELQQLTMPCLVIGAEDDISFPGKDLIARAEKQIPNVETELLKNSKHSPPTTQEFREWLSERIKNFAGV